MIVSHTAPLSFIEELSLVRPQVADRDELLTLLADSGLARGYVGEGFREALLEREASFPTGLPTPLTSAIPHADTRFVRRPGLVAALLGIPLRFGEMGGAGREVEVELVVLLLVDEPQAQVQVLSQLLRVLQAPDLRTILERVRTPRQLADVLDRLLTPG